MEFLPRVIDGRLSRWLRGQPAVRLEGPRGCGKTTTALQHAGSAVHLDANPGMPELAQLDPDRILTGTAPHLVDEWRLAPSLWPQITSRLGEHALPGRYLLASSATPLEYRHRTREAAQLPVLRMRTMTLSERLGVEAPVSLAGLAYGDRVTGIRSRLSYAQLAEHAVRGGWPELLDADTDAAISYNASYLHSFAHTDLKTLVMTRHQPDRITDLLVSLARHTARDVSLAGLGHNTSAGSAATPSAPTSTPSTGSTPGNPNPPGSHPYAPARDSVTAPRPPRRPRAGLRRARLRRRPARR